MASFKVKAQLLNVRTEPVEEFSNKKNIIGKLKKDAPFESIDEQTNKLGVWYKDANKHWVWGEGLDSLPTPFNSLINYGKIAFTNIPSSIKATKGDKVRIAIIDTGINKSHPAFQSQEIKPIFNAIDNNNKLNDINGHGSHVAGIVGARGLVTTGIIGIAPLSELLLIKGVDDDKSTSASDLNNALKHAIDLSPDIINLSLDIPEERFGIIENEINRAKDKGIMIIAAAGENERLTENDTIFCPASKAGIIAVGSCDEVFLKGDTIFNKKINYVVPNYSYWSCSNEAKVYSQESGSSMATAFVTAIISLIISFGTHDKEEILKSLKDLSLPISQFSAGQICLLDPLK
ncbi:MAG: hypothetical protein BGP13_16185 [Sphingobacteriales bacterium 40-81]|nr:MAG: hypothetical protein BGP13_16185 [Sphingobacteriales bacterium 40-81]